MRTRRRIEEETNETETHPTRRATARRNNQTTMAHPKRRQSKTRSRKRRTHYKAETPNVSTCSSTGQAHMFHRAHWYEGKLYYKGRVVMEKQTAEA